MKPLHLKNIFKKSSFYLIAVLEILCIELVFDVIHLAAFSILPLWQFLHYPKD